MGYNKETGKHRIDESQAQQIRDWLLYEGGVLAWLSAFDPDESKCWYTAGIPVKQPDPAAQKTPWRLLDRQEEFEVVILEEVFRKTLPANARPGVALSDELIEAYTKQITDAFDREIGPDNPANQFRIEPSTAKPWLYDGVIYRIKEVVPLREYAARIGTWT